MRGIYYGRQHHQVVVPQEDQHRPGEHRLPCFLGAVCLSGSQVSNSLEHHELERLTTMNGTMATSRPASIGATPRRIIFPWLAVNSMPLWIKGTTPVASTVIVVPDCSVILRTAFSSWSPSPTTDVSMVSVAPSCLASLSREATRSIPMIFRHPRCFAALFSLELLEMTKSTVIRTMIAASPTPPRPMMPTLSEALAQPSSVIVPAPV